MPVIGPHTPPVFRVLRNAYRKWMATQAVDLTGSNVTVAGELSLTGNVGDQRIVPQVKVTITKGGVTMSKMAPVSPIGVFTTKFTGLTAGSYNAVAAITTVSGKTATGGPYAVT